MVNITTELYTLTQREGGVKTTYSASGIFNFQESAVETAEVDVCEELKRKLRVLYQTVGTILNDYIEQFIRSDRRENAVLEFDREEISRLAETIFTQKSFLAEFSEFENIRGVVSSTIDLLQSSVYLYKDFLAINTTNDQLKERVKILDDTDLLREYIQELSRQMTLFPEQEVQISVQAAIKPEYLEYIKRYGMPENAIFDADKLGEIIVDLGLDLVD